MLSAVAFVVVNLLIDLAYPLLDPRVVVRGRRQSVQAVLAGPAGDAAASTSAPASVSAEAGVVTEASTVVEERS
jgi:peptide/nickel transport system permease protein